MDVIANHQVDLKSKLNQQFVDYVVPIKLKLITFVHV